MQAQPKLRYATIFISDVHLGMKGMHAQELAGFLDVVDCGHLIINGDIIDEHRMRLNGQDTLPEAHMQVLDKIQQKIREGVRVTYVTGNHEPTLRRNSKTLPNIEGIEVVRKTTLQDNSGRRFLITHGDEFMERFTANPVMIKYGMGFYEALIKANNIVDDFSRKMLRTHFSAVSIFRQKVDGLVGMIKDFETAAAKSIADQAVDGIVCGHVHNPALKEIDGKIYANTGDWVEHCSALALTHDGRWELFDWRDKRKELALEETAPPATDPALRKKSESFLRRVLGA